MFDMWEIAAWRKSSHSPDWDDCVELAAAPDAIGIRDSKQHGGPVLEFGRHDLAGLLIRVRAGALDL